MDLFSPKQYRGVDREESVIVENQKFHGGEVEFIHGQWEQVIHQAFIAGVFKPHLIYLDTEVKPTMAAIMTAYTMPRCPLGTVLVVNMVTNNRWGREELDKFIDLISECVPAHSLERWRHDVESFSYVGDKGVRMVQVALCKRESLW